MTDEQQVEELQEQALSGMTPALAEELAEYITHEDDAVARTAIGAFEYGPQEAAATESIDYHGVVSQLAQRMRGSPDPDLRFTILDTLHFVVTDHDPDAAAAIEPADQDWVTDALEHDIYTIRLTACELLRGLDDPSVADRLETVAETDDSEAVREAAARAVEAVRS
jgi:HEAT repeat protein